MRFDKARLSTGLRVHYALYQETGHCPNWERPEWVAGDIADFVAGAARGWPRRDCGQRTAFDLKG